MDGHPGNMMIRDATLTDWSAIWPFLREIVAAGETYTWPRDVTEERARDMWLVRPPSRTVVAVDQDGTVLGSAKMNPNQLGLGSHIASASFMVAPPYAGRGSGRALGEQALRWARVEGYRGMRFNAVVETNTASVRLGKSLGFEILGHAQGISAPDPRLRQAAHHAPPALTADLVGTWPAGAGRRSLSPHSGCEYPVRQPVDERSSSPGRSVRP